MTDKWAFEAAIRPTSEREFRETYLGEPPLITEAQREAERRLKHRGREAVLRYLCHEIDRETDPAQQEHLRRVRDVVVEK